MLEHQSAAIPVLDDSDYLVSSAKVPGIFPFIERGPMHYQPVAGY